MALLVQRSEVLRLLPGPSRKRRPYRVAMRRQSFNVVGMGMRFAALLSFISVIGLNTVEASGYDCRFTTVCYENTGCVNEDLLIEVQDTDGVNAKIVTPGLTFPAKKQFDEGKGLVTGTIAYASVLTRDTMYLLTIYPNTSSRLSIHAYLNDALSINARGTCTAN